MGEIGHPGNGGSEEGDQGRGKEKRRDRLHARARCDDEGYWTMTKRWIVLAVLCSMTSAVIGAGLDHRLSKVIAVKERYCDQPAPCIDEMFDFRNYSLAECRPGAKMTATTMPGYTFGVCQCQRPTP